MLDLDLDLDLDDAGVVVPNAAPTDIAWAGSHSVSEFAELGTQVGGILTAVDPELDVVSFSLTDDADARFAIGSGGTTIIVARVLDYETAASHSITVRATDSGALTYDEVFSITVTNQTEAAPADPPPAPDPDPVVDDPGHFDVLPYSVTVGGAVKFAGKKKQNGLSAKMLHDFMGDVPLAVGKIYTIHWVADFSLMTLAGVRTQVGIVFKHSNDFLIAGLRGDGGAGADAVITHGDNKWNQTSGFTDVDGGDAQHGDQSEAWLQIETAADGSQITVRTSADGSDWDDEFTAQSLGPFTSISEVTQWGLGAIFHSADSGPYSIAVDVWTEESAEAVDPYGASVVLLWEGDEANGTIGGTLTAHTGQTISFVDGSISNAHAPTGATCSYKNGLFAGASVPTSVNWDLTNGSTPFSVEWWAFQEEIQDWWPMSQTPGGGQSSWRVRMAAGLAHFMFTTDGVSDQNVAISPVGEILVNNGYHMALTMNSSGKMRMRKNGVVIASETPASRNIFQSNQPLRIGGPHPTAKAWSARYRITKGVDRYDTDSTVVTDGMLGKFPTGGVPTNL